MRRYALAATAEELLTQVPLRGSELDAHTDYLTQRWQEGCTNAAWLAKEPRARGYRGAERNVRRLLQSWRSGVIPPTATPISTPKPRQVTGWIIRPAAERTEEEQTDLTRILDRCKTLRRIDESVSDFAGMLRQRQGRHLDTWITDAQANDIQQTKGFAAGLLKDYDEVRNGLALARSGAVEGAVGRLKSIKRQMYARRSTGPTTFNRTAREVAATWGFRHAWANTKPRRSRPTSIAPAAARPVPQPPAAPRPVPRPPAAATTAGASPRLPRVRRL